MEIGHIGLYVTDFDRMLAFYQQVFGFAVTYIARNDKRSIVFLTADPTSHHQLVLVTGRPDADQHLVNQVSFRLKTLAELRRVYKHLVDMGVGGLEPLTHGIAWSVYFPDPDGNRVEAYVDTPWYITQPHRTTIDLLASEDDIYALTEKLCRDAPGFKTMPVWSEDVAREIQPV
ncbi:Biphenyl-2,3-diol 1,2-dioxygenase [Novosphingobium sp. Rr 2-17]|uniref:VOC family protein n=1 Tax=Novosphingobium sp. Rr 2-17 TaxID=555793 RepID=UPI0002697B9F|nr:VOC family protein [Novosphingobium sp. Rr 2-17]EIZ78331.1 Biphenyl-2,3-diol 1,2-dioxygenase [Novosphingobium sp. Rr 2-17]